MALTEEQKTLIKAASDKTFPFVERCEVQTLEVDRVKRSENGVIADPVTLRPGATVGEARAIMTARNIGGVPITDEDGNQSEAVSVVGRQGTSAEGR